MERRKVVAVGLISGGLDSLLAAKVLQQQGIEVIGVTFDTPFWDSKQACEIAELVGIPIRVVNISEEHLNMVKNPVYGYGSNMNPCIDCHALMLRAAGRIMEQEGADFLFTGEVLGQRPMSQRFNTLRSVEKLSGYQGLVLRPLSAKLLPETEVEKRGLVDRSRLLAIQGRSRRQQMELAEKFGIVKFTPPGGGCLLTKEGFSRKLKRLLLELPDAEVRHIEMLKHSRFFVLDEGVILFVGRNHHDNKELERLAGEKDVLFNCRGVPGPRGLLVVRDQAHLENYLRLCSEIVASFSDAKPGGEVLVDCGQFGDEKSNIVIACSRDKFSDMMIK